MSDDDEPTGDDNVIVADFGRPPAKPPAASESQRMPITRVPGSDAELERALASPSHEAWLDVIEIIDIRLERPRERDDLVANILPMIEAEVARWPAEILRPASPEWLEAHDAGDALATRLLALTRAPGGWVLTRYFCDAGHDEPSNGTILHETVGGLERDCAAFFDTVSLSVDLATCVLGVELELCVMRWGVAVAPKIDVCELLSFELFGKRLTLASARRDPARTRAQIGQLDAPRDPLSTTRPIELHLGPLPTLPIPRATARLSELAATERDEGSPVHHVLGVIDELHGSWA